MEVYIEYVIIDNLIINFLLLYCVIRVLGIKPTFFRILLSSIFGTITVCLFPLIAIPKVMLILSKIAVGVIMVLLSYNFKSLKQFVLAFLLFVIFTFMMGGACYAFIKLLGGNPENLNAGNYDTIIPISLIILTGFIYAFIIVRLTKYIYRKKDMIPFIHSAKLKNGDKEISLTAFIDSGNRLHDNKTGAPVIILSAFALEKYYTEDQMVKLVFGEKNNIFKNVHYLSYGTIEGVQKKMVVFEADELIVGDGAIQKFFYNISIGVVFKKFNDAVNYDMLLHPAMLEIRG